MLSTVSIPPIRDGDDIIVFTDERRTKELVRFPMLRQQWEREGQTCFRSLADYVAPVSTGVADYLGAFAVTAGVGAEELVKQFEADHDDYNAIMAKALADRLAEAFAELLHERARRDWGYGRDEQLSKEELIDEKYRGIRPAAGLSVVSRSHREGNAVEAAGNRRGRWHSPDGELRDVAGRIGERTVLQSPGGTLFRGRYDHEGSG